MRAFAIIFIISSLLFSAQNINCQDFRSLVEEAGKCYENKQFDSAAILLEAAIPLIEIEFGANDTSYLCPILDKIAISYQYSHQNDKAEKYFLQEKKIYEAVNAHTCNSYLLCLQSLGYLYSFQMGRYKDAEKIWNQCDSLFIILGDGYEIGYANNLNNMALLYGMMGRNEQAIALLQQSKDIVKVELGENSPEYTNLLHNLAVKYYTMGNYYEAEITFLQAKELSPRNNIDQDRYYAVLMSNLGNLYRAMGRYDLAAPLYAEAIEIFKTQSVEEINWNYTSILNNLALVYLKQGKFSDAEVLLREALEIDGKISGSNHTSYARNLNNLGNVEKAEGNYELSEAYVKQALEIYKSQLGELNQDYASVLSYLGDLYSLMGRYAEADSLFLKTLGIYELRFGNQHPKYADVLNDRGQNLILMHDLMNAGYCFEQAFEIYKYQIRTNTGFLSQNELEIYLNTFLYRLDKYQSNNFDRIVGQQSDGRFAYNMELTRKGILMASALRVKTDILESGDTSAINIFYDLRSLRKKIDKIKNTAPDKQKEDPEILEAMANEKEKSLALKSINYQKAQLETEITWRDVFNKLDPDQASVEFTNFHYYDGRRMTDSILYCAVLQAKTDTLPIFVVLCEENQLKAALPASGADIKNIDPFYKDQTLYDLIWKPIDSLLQGINTVYFAPSGLLNSVSMAAIKCPDKKFLSEKYNLVQLSSTRTLAMPEESVTITDAIVFGGIKYQADTTEWLASARYNQKKESELLAYVSNFRGPTRGGWLYLPGTKKEAGLVAEKLARHDIDTTTFTGVNALEESFYSLSGNNSPSIIHISTHGFYYPDTVSEEYRKNMMFSTTGDIQFKYADDPLLRSGLILAGGNNTWKGLPRPEGVEDGILTAREVSNMNLLNTELVVLSACQTGQGDVKGSEGVEGLQRGFKMAGVHYLIMSLWEVPDKETTEFMDHFYSLWPGGELSIHSAFRETQLKMMRKYPNEPYKWAGFVLME